MKKVLPIILIVIIGLLLLAFFALHGSMRKKSEIILSMVKEKIELEQKIKYLKQEISVIEESRLEDFKLYLNGLDFSIKALGSNESLKISDLPTQTNVFYFSLQHCKSCYENELSIINSFSKENENISIVIISDIDSDKKLSMFKSSYGIEVPLFRLSGSVASLPPKPLYMKVIDNNICCNFFANENYNELSQEYLQLDAN